MPTFKGSTLNVQCSYPGCKEIGIERHHITYDPEVIANLCRKHREDITIINGQQARRYRRDLTSKWRWFIWHRWIEGNLKARRTAKAMEYIEEMHRTGLY